MSIIVSKKGEKAIKVDKTDFEKEGFLQEYIHMNPESIPVYEIEETKRLLVLSREFPTASGPIDALAIDKDGDIYVIETKLYKNPDKRKVLAQALDYGASLWKHYYDFSEFLKVVEVKVQADHGVSAKDRICDFLDLEDEDYSRLLDETRANLIQGNIKFVILMDWMDERLKDLIIYVNQHSQFDIFAVEVEYYKIDEYEIIVPKLFGVEVKKVIPPRPKEVWNRETFLADAEEKIQDQSVLDILTSLHDFCDNSGDILAYGSGKDKASITYKFADDRAASGLVSLFTVYSDGYIAFRFPNINKRLGTKASEVFDSMLKKILDARNWDNKEVLRETGFGPKLPVGKAFCSEDVLRSFETTVQDYVKRIKGA